MGEALPSPPSPSLAFHQQSKWKWFQTENDKFQTNSYKFNLGLFTQVKKKTFQTTKNNNSISSEKTSWAQ